MSRSTATALRLVPESPELELPQEQLPGPAPASAGADRELSVVPTTAVRTRRARGLLRVVGARVTGERGMAVAEYAVGLIAACAFAFVLYKVVNSGPIAGLLANVITVALSKLP